MNEPDDVFVQREGRIEHVRDRLFEGEEPVMHVIERIVGPLGLRVDHASPWVDARLPDGSRVQTQRTRACFDGYIRWPARNLRTPRRTAG